MSHRITFLALAVAISTTACATVTVTPLGAPSHFTATPDSVAIPLYTTVAPTCSYDEIAAVSSQSPMLRGAAERVTESLRQNARAVGGQAIIGFVQSQYTIAGPHGMGSTQLTRSGTAIRFRSADCVK